MIAIKTFYGVKDEIVNDFLESCADIESISRTVMKVSNKDKVREDKEVWSEKDILVTTIVYDKTI